jgi:hypothetical protein
MGGHTMSEGLMVGRSLSAAIVRLSGAGVNGPFLRLGAGQRCYNPPVMMRYLRERGRDGIGG